MPIDCPNKGHADWKRLVQDLKKDFGDKAETMAETSFHRAGEIPTPQRARKILGPRAGFVAKANRNVREFFSETYDDLKKWYYPEGRSQMADKTATWLREQIGKASVAREKSMRQLDRLITTMHKGDSTWARAKDRFSSVGKTAADVFLRGQSDISNRSFMQWVDTGVAPEGWKPTKEHAAIAAVIRKFEDDKVAAVRALGTGKLQQLRENYFPHLWTTASRKAFSQAISEAFKQFPDAPKDLNEWTPEQRQWVRGRVGDIRDGKVAAGDAEDRTSMLVGGRWLKTPGSLKKRVFSDVNTGVDFGLELQSHNPLDVMATHWDALDRYIASHTVKDALKDDGGAKFVPLGGEAPANMQPMSNGEVFAPPAEGEFGPRLTGHWYVEKSAGQVIENYLSPSLWGNTLFRTYMGAASRLNMFQLGMGSAFHAGFTSMEAIISHNAEAMKFLVKGQYKAAFKNFSESPAEVVKNFQRGNRYMRHIAGETANDTWAAKVAGWVEMAGGNTMQDRRMFTTDTDRFAQAIQNREVGTAALEFLPTMAEQLSRYILEYLVPRQKIGVFSEMMSNWEKGHSGASHEETTRAAQEAWNRVDSRLGEVVYKRLFVNNIAKNVVQALIRAPGWTGGTILEVGGGFRDIAKYLKDQTTNPKEAVLTDRAAYTLSLILTTAVANGILTALFTGEQPDAHDMLAFRTGEKDEHGNPQRWMLPTYMKDLYAYSREPGKTLVNKTHPMISLMADLERNRDYYGTEIRHPGDNLMNQMFDMGTYTVKAFQPFWSRGVQKVAERQGTTAEKVLPLVGVMPAPALMTATPAQRMASELQRPGGQTQEQFQRRQLKKRVEISAEKQGPQAVQQAIQAGEIGPDTGRQVLKDLGTPPILRATRNLDSGGLAEVYAKGNEEERRLLRPRIVMAWMRYRNTHSAQDTADMKKKLQRLELIP